LFRFGKKKEEFDLREEFQQKYGSRFYDRPLSEQDLFDIINSTIQSRSWYIVIDFLGEYTKTFLNTSVASKKSIIQFSKEPLINILKKDKPADYLAKENIGKGSFGELYKVFFASKKEEEFLKKEEEILERLALLVITEYQISIYKKSKKSLQSFCCYIFAYYIKEWGEEEPAKTIAKAIISRNYELLFGGSKLPNTTLGSSFKCVYSKT